MGGSAQGLDADLVLLGGVFNGSQRSAEERLIGNQNVQQDIGVESGDHRPRMASMNWSSRISFGYRDLAPGLAKESAARC
jgi:hypothetical protein